MGSVEQDAFYPPHELCVEIQDFLDKNEPLFSRQTCNDVAMVYSVESEFQRAARRDQVANDPLNLARGGAIPFWTICATPSVTRHSPMTCSSSQTATCATTR